MITKKQYAIAMEKLAELSRAEHEMCLAARNMNPDCWFYPCAPYEELIVDILEAAIGDKNTWTSYFAWERDFDLSKPCVHDKDGNVVPTTTWEEVYDLIESWAEREV